MTTTTTKQLQLLEEAGPDDEPPKLAGPSNSRNKKAKLRPDLTNCTEMLSDELLVDILIQFFSDATCLARFSGVNKRFQSLLNDERVVKRVLQERLAANNHSMDVLLDGGARRESRMWSEVGFYQAVMVADLLKENRIGFDFASTDVDSDSGEASLIEGSTRRIDAIGRVLQQFEHAIVTIEAHCGTAAPPQIATMFSRVRGQVVYNELVNSDHDILAVPDRIILHPWGRRVAQQATVSPHPNGKIARKGRGWVEVYVKLGDTELPQRPPYYDGLELDDEETFVEQVMW